ncbi:MAG: hypothetical protein QM811_20460 [Pirellulales bacterium]
MKYLLNNRKHATYWNSTRDTSYAIEALADYLKASGEDKPDLNVEVWLDGEKRKELKITAADLFTMDNTFVLEGKDVTGGKHVLELKKSGKGPLYYNAYVTNFTLEDRIAKAGLEVKVNRKFYKLVKADKTIAVAGSRGQAVEQKVEKYDRVELADVGELKSGELLEVELEIDSKNDYEYVLFEDLKAAGCEAVDVRSGYTGNAMGAYVEFRDNRTAFFIRALRAASTRSRTASAPKSPAHSTPSPPKPKPCTPPNSEVTPTNSSSASRIEVPSLRHDMKTSWIRS